MYWRVHIDGLGEGCTWDIYFKNTQPLPLVIPLDLDLSGETPVFNSHAYWTVGMNGISETEKCESFACDANYACDITRDPVCI